MHKIRFAIFLLLLLCFTPAAALASTGHIANRYFGFAFDLPRGWEAYSASPNHDTYIVVAGRSKANDLRVLVTGGDIPESAGARIEPFQFADGAPGKKMFGYHSLIYSRIIGGYTIALVVDAPEAWIRAHAGAIEKLAFSLRPGR